MVFVCAEVLQPSQPIGVMLTAVSLLILGRLSPLGGKPAFAHILLPGTDNCPSGISRRERMPIENIS